MTRMYKFFGTFSVTKEDVFDYYDANDIEYDPATAEPTEADFQATAESLVEDGILEITDVIRIG